MAEDSVFVCFRPSEKALPGRLELPTLRLTASRSSQLSYGSMLLRIPRVAILFSNKEDARQGADTTFSRFFLRRSRCAGLPLTAVWLLRPTVSKSLNIHLAARGAQLTIRSNAYSPMLSTDMHAETRDRAGDLQIFSLTLSQLSYRGCGIWSVRNTSTCKCVAKMLSNCGEPYVVKSGLLFKGCAMKQALADKLTCARQSDRKRNATLAFQLRSRKKKQRAGNQTALPCHSHARAQKTSNCGCACACASLATLRMKCCKAVVEFQHTLVHLPPLQTCRHKHALRPKCLSCPEQAFLNFETLARRAQVFQALRWRWGTAAS